jgi:hypothetical protein
MVEQGLRLDIGGPAEEAVVSRLARIDPLI